MRRAAWLVGAVLLLVTSACGRRYEAAAAPGFVKLEQSQEPYAWRAVAPDGVAVAVRVVRLEDRGDLSFWAHAVTLRMRDMDGYALVDTRDVKSRDGTEGKELTFGHDEDGKPFVYRVRLYLGRDRLFVVEAGGAKDQMDRYAASVEWMMATVKLT